MLSLFVELPGFPHKPTLKQTPRPRWIDSKFLFSNIGAKGCVEMEREHSILAEWAMLFRFDGGRPTPEACERFGLQASSRHRPSRATWDTSATSSGGPSGSGSWSGTSAKKRRKAEEAPSSWMQNTRLDGIRVCYVMMESKCVR